MQYNFDEAVQVLERTPAVLKALLSGLHADWTMTNEGPETFSPYDVVGHLVHGERADWRLRIEHILSYGNSKPFEVFDRFAMYTESEGKTMDDLLEEFTLLRRENIEWFKSLQLAEVDLERVGYILFSAR